MDEICDITRSKKPLIGVFPKNAVNSADKEVENVYIASIESSNGIALVLPYDTNGEVLKRYVSNYSP